MSEIRRLFLVLRLMENLTL